MKQHNRDITSLDGSAQQHALIANVQETVDGWKHFLDQCLLQDSLCGSYN